jgi:predicted nuclease of predicted toxin-antitoxin system
MKIKIDENMPDDLVGPLVDLGHDVDTVRQELLTGEPDPVVRRAAKLETRFLITQDVKLVDERVWLADPGAGVMLVRVPNETRRLLIEAVMRAYMSEDSSAWVGRIVVATLTRVRVRPLSGDRS